MVDETSIENASLAILQEPLLPTPTGAGASETAITTTTTEGREPGESSAERYSQEDDEEVLYDGLTSLSQSILVKSLYFLDALGSSTWGRFSAIYYNSHNLNSQHIGLIEGLRTSIPTLSMVFWGIISDKYNCRKNVWVLTKAVSTIILLLLALPYVYQSFIRILGKFEPYLHCKYYSVYLFPFTTTNLSPKNFTSLYFQIQKQSSRCRHSYLYPVGY